jgi:ABC-2 type transport system ATP-binding protein
MEAVFNREIERASADGATVLLSSHILSEVEQLCDRVSIIRAGKTVDTGTLAELRHLTRTEISFAHANFTDVDLARIPGSHSLSVAGGRVRFTVDSHQVASVLPALAELDVQGLTVAPPSLEELFLRHYGDELVEAEAEAEAESAAADVDSGTLSRRAARAAAQQR